MSFSFVALNLKGMLGLLSGVSRCCALRQYVLVIGLVVLQARRTTLSESLLLTAGDARKARDCCLHTGREALEAALNASGTSFEAIARV